MNKQIDQGVHNLLNYFEKSKREVNNNTKTLQGTSTTYIGEVKNATYSREDLTGRKIEWHKSLENGELIGFSEKNYVHVATLANQIFKIPLFQKYATIGLVEGILCEWVFKKYLKETIAEPYSFLINSLENKIEDYIFYFPIEAIEIEHNFKIGNCHIICFDEYFESNEIEKFKLGSPNNTREQFESVLKRLKNRIVAVICCKGVIERAEKDAKYKVQISVDLLKAFLIEESINPHFTMCDLEFNSYLLPKYNMFYQTSNDYFDLTSGIRSNTGVYPVQITADILQEHRKKGFEKLSKFIKTDSRNEVDQIILRTISEIGNYTSERNVYERIVKIISTFESIFVPQKKGKGKGLTIMKSKVLPKILSKLDLEMGIEIFIAHYNIRDKYLHNRLELRIDSNKLYKLQYIGIILTKKLLLLREKCRTEEELAEFFEIHS